MDILNVIALIVCMMTGVVAGWFWGYQAAYRKMAKDAVDSFIFISHCIQCGGTIPDHFHGCPIAADFKLITIAEPAVIEDSCPECGAPLSNHCPGCPKAKPDVYIPGLRDLAASRPDIAKPEG